MRQVKFGIPELILLLLLTPVDMTSDIQNDKGGRQSQDTNTPCDINCLCNVSPLCWNLMKVCPEAFDDVAVEGGGDKNTDAIESEGESSYFIPVPDGPQNNPVEDYSFFMSDSETPQRGHFEADNFIPGLERAEADALQPDNSHQDHGNFPEEEENENLNKNLRGSEGGTLDKINLETDISGAVRKRRNIETDQERQGGERDGSSVANTTITPLRRQSTSCLYPLIYREPLTGDFGDRFLHKMHRVIHDCKDTLFDTDLQSKCFDFRNTSSLERVLPVADRATGRIYANRFCAECNGVHDFDKFTTQFICNDKVLEKWEFLTMDRTHDNQMELIKLGLCVYYFKPQNTSIQSISENKCISITHNHCNQTENTRIASTNIWSWCDSKDWFKDHNACSMGDEKPNQTNVSKNNRLLRRCVDRCMKDFSYVMSVSFFELINLEQTLQTPEDGSLSGKSDQRCHNQTGDIYDHYTNICRRVLCPAFHVQNGHDCKLVNSGFLELAAILFQELNRTDKDHDPYEHFEQTIFPLIKHNILHRLFELGAFVSDTGYAAHNVAAIQIFLKLYKEKVVNNTDFVLEFAWLAGKEEKFIPDIYVRLFNSIELYLPIPHTSFRFVARSVTTFQPHGDYITVGGTMYTLVFSKEYKGEMRETGHEWFDENTLYLPMTRLLVCKRVSLSLVEFSKSAGVLHHPSGITISLPDDYILTGNAIEICADDYFDKANIVKTFTRPDTKGKILHDIVVILSFACSCISIICLLVTIVSYLFLTPLRTVPGKINLYLCISLLMAQTLQQFTMDLDQYQTFCIICGVFIHFTWSASLLWMNVSSFHLFRCFSTANLGRRDFQPSLGMYSFYVVCMSSLFVVTNMGYTFIRYSAIGYGGHLCYISTKMGLLITFVIPVGLIVLANLGFLSITIWRISRVPKLDGSKSTDRNNVLIYIKMSTLTGICWIFGFLRILTEVEVFEILFILANASQGLFIMISFICNRRVMDLFKEVMPKLCTEKNAIAD